MVWFSPPLRLLLGCLASVFVRAGLLHWLRASGIVGFVNDCRGRLQILCLLLPFRVGFFFWDILLSNQGFLLSKGRVQRNNFYLLFIYYIFSLSGEALFSPLPRCPDFLRFVPVLPSVLLGFSHDCSSTFPSRLSSCRLGAPGVCCGRLNYPLFWMALRFGVLYGGELLFQLDPCGTGTGSRLLLWICS